ncbi:hypothetical protein FHR24_000139 [Wenyingzhuangia heitensis]|uniref:Lipoprotein n=1 Tax=Wenyingzhuangia heitensis TaxID=1487859 RepID=A0ABX0U6U8_9FLAO|nr:hypothetical protein [Wenyingzhuangia heitensis]NIJ43700.1 hypothetical protein [Wenyingzhuangia heitensis]
MKTRKFLNGLIGIFLLAACACTKDIINEKLPPITTTGANTFGCYIDGELLVPKDNLASWTPGTSPVSGIELLHNSLEGDSKGNLTLIGGNYKDSGGDEIYIYIYNMNEKGVYLFEEGCIPRGDFSELEVHHAVIRKMGEKNKIYLTYRDSGSITIIKYDPEKRIYSGTFSFKAVNRDDSNDIIEITEGRFDIDVIRLRKEFKDKTTF